MILDDWPKNFDTVRASPRALQTNFALLYLQKRVENTPPMVLQIRFAIWLILQIDVEALHICKPSHHFASTILAFYVGLRPPAPPPRAISLRPPPSLQHAPALPTARARSPAAARARRPSSCRACPPVPPAGGSATTETRARPRTTTYAATARERRWTFHRGDLPSEEDGAELTRTTTATNDERGLGWAATGAKTWAGRQLAAT